MSSYYEDHIKAVGLRQAKKLIAGEKAADIRKVLLSYGWSKEETDRIMRIAEKAVE